MGRYSFALARGNHTKFSRSFSIFFTESNARLEVDNCSIATDSFGQCLLVFAKGEDKVVSLASKLSTMQKMMLRVHDKLTVHRRTVDDTFVFKNIITDQSTNANGYFINPEKESPLEFDFDRNADTENICVSFECQFNDLLRLTDKLKV